MSVTYNKYYQTEDLFGAPSPELIEFFTGLSKKGKVLDLGCGQGRDAIPIARLGFEVVGIDNSEVGIEQMNRIAEAEQLNLKGQVADIFKFDDFSGFNFVLLDSMFHFAKKDRIKETDFIKNILSNIDPTCLLIICIQDNGKKVEILNETLDINNALERIVDQKYKYVYTDSESGHTSESDYRMIVVKK